MRDEGLVYVARGDEGRGVTRERDNEGMFPACDVSSAILREIRSFSWQCA